MIQILVVEDQPYKQETIRTTILQNIDIKTEYLQIVGTVKEAKKLLYANYYDLMILDLVLPNEKGDEALPQSGSRFLDDIHNNPMINPPTHIIGLTGFSEFIEAYRAEFSKKLWHLIEYRAESTAWQENLKTIIYHLVKTRQRFIQESVKIQPYDVAIITALAFPELEAVMKLGNKEWKKVIIENDSTTYFRNTFEAGDKKIEVIAACADQMGFTAASHLSTKIILYFRPRYIIMTGILAGIKEKELGFGDIIFAEQSWDYGSGKMVQVNSEDSEDIKDVKFEPDLRPIQLSADLKSKVTSFQLTHGAILDKIQNEWAGDSPATKLKMHLGPVASGSYVIANTETLAEIKKHQRKLLGVEMETYGVYYAAEHSPKAQTKAISIKSVTDYGDGEKNDKYHKYAAYTSANAAFHFIAKELDF